jgi:hypothetical protein
MFHIRLPSGSRMFMVSERLRMLTARFSGCVPYSCEVVPQRCRVTRSRGLPDLIQTEVLSLNQVK